MWPRSESRDFKQLVTVHPQPRAERKECTHVHALAALCSAQFAHPCTVRDPCLGSDATHSGLGLPTSINLDNSPPTGMPPVDNVNDSSLRFSSWVARGPFKLTVQALTHPHPAVHSFAACTLGAAVLGGPVEYVWVTEMELS